VPAAVPVRVLSANQGTPDVLEAIARAAPADVVLLDPSCVLTDGSVSGLRRAAYSDSRVATASAIVTDADGAAAAAIAANSLCLRPRLRAPSRQCVYIRRTALELIGDFDAGFYRRCAERGLLHVLADDVLVAGEQEDWVPADGPLRRALSRARRTLHGTSVVIDARILSREMTGTEVQVLEIIGALARSGQVRVSAVVPNRLRPYAAQALESLPDVTLVRPGEPARADIVHRPYQASNPGDLAFLASLGERLILTSPDLIAYHNRSYFDDEPGWHGFRHLTRLTLAAADRVVFMSAHARDDAIAEDLVDPSRASVVHIGVDHSVVVARKPPVAPGRASGLPESAETILCLGTDYRHKNRLFALQILQQLRARDAWDGYLVFAGPSVRVGSSRPDESELLGRHPELAGAVIDTGAVSEAEKEWLLRRAGLVVYPTTYEGFGLVPFEAAAHGVACLWAPGTSLSEVLPDDAAAIVPWDAAASAARALELLRDASARERQVGLIREAARRLSWEATAASLLELYEATCDAPAPPMTALERASGLMSGAVSEDAMRLVGPAGVLPADVERPLLALATHPRLGAPLFRALTLGYRAAYRLRRRGATRS
jgi:glycosyltransferase involved in cell wall biosynthesis